MRIRLAGAYMQVVWCSGQSNIAGQSTPLSAAIGGAVEVAVSAKFPWIRVFAVGPHGDGSRVPLQQLAFPPSIPWSVASPTSVASFAAVCWFHGRTLAESLGPGIPIGLIESAWSGTPLQVGCSVAATASRSDRMRRLTHCLCRPGRPQRLPPHVVATPRPTQPASRRSALCGTR